MDIEIVEQEGEIICKGKTIGWFKDLKSYLDVEIKDLTD